VKLVEPPSCSSASTITLIGRNSRGNWVAQEQNGLYGGLFVNRAQAFKYALFENGHHPETIIELSHEIELDLNGAPPPPLFLPERGKSPEETNSHHSREREMIQLHPASGREQVLDTMIELTRLSICNARSSREATG
jgi:hypothetical protein